MSVALLLCAAACGGKTDTVPVSPPSATPPAAPDELELRLEALRTQLERARVQHQVPGMAVVVVKDDTIILAEGFGVAELESGRPVTPETVFAIGSSTKAFTSALVAMQVDAGKLSWDEVVTEQLPEFHLRPRLAAAASGEAREPAQVTLRDLLCHRSGFTRMSLLWVNGALSIAELLTVASGAEPIAEFRTKFLYNNVTYAAAGEAAARSAGISWAQLVQTRLLEPLGMSSTGVSVTAAAADPRLAQGYRWREVSEVHEAQPMRPLDTIAAAGAINSNVLDMAQWLRLQLGRGSYEGKQLISKERVEDTWTAQIEMGGGLSYGLGWMLGEWRGRRVVEHGGNIDGYAAMVAMLPDEGLGFVLLTNISATPLQRESMAIVFEGLLGEVPKDAQEPGERPNLSPYTGRYVANFGPFEDARFTVSAEANKLYVDVPGQTKYELRPPTSDGRWVFAATDTIALSFTLDDEGRGQVLHMFQAGLEHELPREGYVFPAEVTPEEVAPLLGRYRSEAPALDARVRMEGGRLVADVEGQMVFVLRKPEAEGDGRWRLRATDAIAVSFRADPNGSSKGSIDALILHQGGVDLPLLRVASDTERPLPSVAQLLQAAKAEAFTRRLEQLGALELSGKVRMPASNIEGRFRLVFDHQRRQRLELDLGRFGRIIETYDGSSAWTVTSFSPATEAQGKYLRQAELASPLLVGDWTRGYAEARVDGRVGEGKAERVAVVLRVEGLPSAKLYVDPKTGDVTAAELMPLSEGTGPIPSRVELSEFRKVLGLRLPHRVSSSNEHTGATILEIEAVKRLEGDAAPLFARPDAP